MQDLIQVQAADWQLLSSIAGAMDEAARRAGDWLVCRPGCTQCCLGPFAITQLDALRLRQGLSSLGTADPARAERVRARAAQYVAAIAPQYPGDRASGELSDEDALPAEMEDAPCPALDPATGCCDLYEFRPITCRAFGPATRVPEGSIAACELCYAGAADEQMAHCAVEVDPDGLERDLLSALDSAGMSGMTIVAYALAQPK